MDTNFVWIKSLMNSDVLVTKVAFEVLDMTNLIICKLIIFIFILKKKLKTKNMDSNVHIPL